MDRRKPPVSFPSQHGVGIARNQEDSETDSESEPGQLGIKTMAGKASDEPPPKPKRITQNPIHQKSEVATGETCKTETEMPLKLETIQLPSFGGDLTEWIALKDLFTYLVHNNCRLSDTLKFHQLRSKLRGSALDTIKGYQLTGINYAAAWAMYNKRDDRTCNLKAIKNLRLCDHKKFTTQHAIDSTRHKFLAYIA